VTTEALDAISRIDDGVPLPGDDVIAGIFDRHSSDRWARMNLQLDEWAADRCVICGVTGDGPECGACSADWDAQMKRLCDR